MKKGKSRFSIITFVFLMALIFPFQMNAQGFSFDQLISLQKKDVIELNDYLLSKGWSFSNSTDETADQYGVSTWAYEKNQFSDGKAQAWLSLWFANNNKNRLVYTISSKANYQIIKKSIISYGMKKINSEIGNNIITTDYQGKHYTVRIQSISDESEFITTYKFILYSSSDYKDMRFAKWMEAKETENQNAIKEAENNVTSVTDEDGNVYKTVKIGNQLWMAENLRTTHYRNGDIIWNLTDGNTWGNTTTGAWCKYENNYNNGSKYGYLYNWYAVSDSRNLAPKGWHIPTDYEWQKLVDFLGGESIAGSKLKEVNGFNGLLAGECSTCGPGNYGCGSYYNINEAGYWWTTTIINNTSWGRYISSRDIGVHKIGQVMGYGFSVRCLKDN